MLLVYTLLIKTFRFFSFFFACFAVINTRLLFNAIKKSTPSALSCLCPPDLSLVPTPAVLAEQGGVELPSGRTSLWSTAGLPPVSRMRSEGKHPLPHQEQLPGPLHPYAILTLTHPILYSPCHISQ